MVKKPTAGRVLLSSRRQQTAQVPDVTAPVHINTLASRHTLEVVNENESDLCSIHLLLSLSPSTGVSSHWLTEMSQVPAVTGAGVVPR